MKESFAKEVSLRLFLKSKGYIFDHENQYWFREWTTNEGQEKVLEVAVKTEDGEWNKLMMTPAGQVFYAKVIGEEVH
tara:strand:- start:83 stop:313 length:231 start_codon:yes stop_codon:yes gene_type:complete